MLWLTDLCMFKGFSIKMDENLPSEIYKEVILDHYYNPRNFGKLAKFTHFCEKKNFSCGDRIKVMLNVVDGLIEGVAFEGGGCALSVATSSILTEYLKGKNVDEIFGLDEKKVMDIMCIRVNEGRIGCLMLAADALKGSLNEDD